MSPFHRCCSAPRSTFPSVVMNCSQTFTASSARGSFEVCATAVNQEFLGRAVGRRQDGVVLLDDAGHQFDFPADTAHLIAHEELPRVCGPLPSLGTSAG